MTTYAALHNGPVSGSFCVGTRIYLGLILYWTRLGVAYFFDSVILITALYKVLGKEGKVAKCQGKLRKIRKSKKHKKYFKKHQKYGQHRPTGSTRHHLKPRSRGGKNNSENIKVIDAHLHQLWHKLFMNWKTDEVIKALQACGRDFFIRDSKELEKAWQYLFGDRSDEAVIECIKKDWSLQTTAA